MPSSSRLITAGKVLGWLAAVNIATMGLVYCLYPGYVDHGEAGISSMAWRMLQGVPAYHAFDSADRTTNLYGPLNFLWNSWPLALFGASIHTSKIAAGFAAALIPLAVWWRMRNWALGGWVMALVGLMLALHLAFPVVIRPDSLLTLVAALAVLALAWGEKGGGWKATLALGVLCGIAVNLKINAVLVMAPLGLYHLMGDWRRIALLGGSALAAALLPFASPLFPPDAYLAWFGPMAAKSTSLRGVFNLSWKLVIPLVLPAVLWVLAGAEGRRNARLADWVYLGCYELMLLATIFPAAKDGGGAHYFMPFLPLTADLCLRAMALGGGQARQRLVLVATTIAVLVMVPQQERRFLKKLEWAEARAISSEIQAIAAAHAGKRIQMGVGGTTGADNLSFGLYVYRNLLVYLGHPYTLDTATVMEMTKLGVPLPAATIRRIETCHTQLWLIPKGEVPFSLWDYYRQYSYSPEFRNAFAEHHRLLESHGVFDVWECRP